MKVLNMCYKYDRYNVIIKTARKRNCITHYFSVENSSVGERPAPGGETTRPDGRKITII